MKRFDKKAYMRKWRADHVAQRKAHKRAWDVANKERKIQHGIRCRSKQLSKLRKKSYDQKYRLRNADRIRIRRHARQLKDVNVRLLHNLRARLREIIHGKGKRPSTTPELIGCSMKDFRIYLESKFEVGMSWENYGSHWHLDHIMPCALFDLSKPEHQKRCFHFSNIQPLEALKNCSKGARTSTDQFNLL